MRKRILTINKVTVCSFITTKSPKATPGPHQRAVTPPPIRSCGGSQHIFVLLIFGGNINYIEHIYFQTTLKEFGLWISGTQ